MRAGWRNPTSSAICADRDFAGQVGIIWASGGTGIRVGLKNPWAQALEGSTPSLPTTKNAVLVRDFFVALRVETCLFILTKLHQYNNLIMSVLFVNKKGRCADEILDSRPAW